jgi:L-2-hydroxyglutarate oxidase LhgO
MTDRINVAIIGGGVVGCWIALEAARQHDGVFLFERNPGITSGENQSSRNSGVNHAGVYYDRATRPLKAAFCVEGNRLWYEFCEKYDLACRAVGKLMVAVSEEEDGVLDVYLKRALENNVPGVRKITGDEVREREPNVRAYSALFLPSSGIFDPAGLLYKVHALAANHGVQFITGTEVIGLQAVGEGVMIRLRYPDKAEDDILAETVINATGVHAVDVARLIDPDFPIRSALVRGDALKFYCTRRPELHINGMNIYPTPIVVDTPTGKQFTVGVHLTPTFDLDRDGRHVIGKTVTLGPKLVPVRHAEDYRTPVPPCSMFLENLSFFPGLQPDDLEPHQSGIQARLNGYPDFYIQRDRRLPSVIHLVGIDSPGFTAAPALAKHVARMLTDDA